MQYTIEIYSANSLVSASISSLPLFQHETIGNR